MKKGLLVRLDDITPDMDWDKFHKLELIFDRLNIKPLLGIVPDNQDPKLHIMEAKADFTERMLQLQAKGWVLSQHGYQHVYEIENSGMLGLHHSSEFAGLSYERQVEKIRTGKGLLTKAGIDVNIFMAPGHTFDENTLKALKVCGFSYVTDGYGYTPYQYQGLHFIPCTLTQPKERPGIDTICIHANTMSDQGIEALGQALEKYQSNMISWQEVLVPAIEKTREISKTEKRELQERQWKAFVATDEIFQSYLQKSNASNRYVKMIKRGLGLPGLGIRLLMRKGKVACKKN